MENSQQNLLSRIRRDPAREIVVIQTDGTVIRTRDPSVYLSHLIDEALAGRRLQPQKIGVQPVEITDEDCPVGRRDRNAVLNIEKRAS